MKVCTAQKVRHCLLTRQEIALFDLRGEALYALGHPLFAASLPLGHMESQIFEMVPRKDTPIVVYDEGEGLVSIAINRLSALGYSDVNALQGGLSGWRAAGYELFQDVNSASKAFGELVESQRNTPSIAAPDAKALIEGEDNLVVLDARRFDEYQNMSIPRGVNVPGAELVLRARTMAPDPSTTIIVNCAGRTRSIIGTQSLINAGLPNPIMALRNGTIGWMLAGQKLDKGRDERFPELNDKDTEVARDLASAVSYRAGVKRIDVDGLVALEQDSGRTLYRFDVRTLEEYSAGHIPGFRSAPGGQLVQETDAFAPVRGARIVLSDDIGPRADMSGSWLAQMGGEVYILEGGFEFSLDKGPGASTRPDLPDAEVIDCDKLEQELSTVRLVDVSKNPAYRRGHIKTAVYAKRSQIEDILVASDDRPIVVTSDDGYLAHFAAAEIKALSGRSVFALEGGNSAWKASGRVLERGEGEELVVPDDVYRRPYEGTDNPNSAMQAYLDWESGLIGQLEKDGTHGFYVI